MQGSKEEGQTKDAYPLKINWKNVSGSAFIPCPLS